MIFESLEQLDSLTNEPAVRGQLRRAAAKLVLPLSLFDLLSSFERGEEAHEIVGVLLGDQSIPDSVHADLLTVAAFFYREHLRNEVRFSKQDIRLERALGLVLADSALPDLTIVEMLVVYFPETLQSLPDSTLEQMSLASVANVRDLGVRCLLVAACSVSSPETLNRYMAQQSSARREVISAFFAQFVRWYLLFAKYWLSGRAVASSLRTMMSGTPVLKEEWRQFFSCTNSPLRADLPRSKSELTDLVDASLSNRAAPLFEKLYFGELFDAPKSG